MNRTWVVAASPTASAITLDPKVPRPECVWIFANSVSNVSEVVSPSIWSSTTKYSKNSYRSFVVSWTWIIKYPASYLSSCVEIWLGYSATTLCVGEPDDEILVIVDCNLACFMSSVDMPEVMEDNPTTTVLTTAFAPIPDGLKSTLIFEPSRRAV